MKIQFMTLTVQCKKSKEVIRFSPQISFFHGKISSGKSSIARLIDFCLGGRLERTPALAQELVSVQLSARIGKYEVFFEREAQESNQVQVTWKDEKGSSGSTLAPLVAAKAPIWEDRVYNLSDLIFYLAGISPIKVPRSGREAEPEMIRLSFRDIMWYCYLEQEYLDSSFYNLRTPMKDRKSRYAMDFVVGKYTERMAKLDTELATIRDQKTRKEAEANHLRSFLKQFGYGSESQISEEIERTNKESMNASSELLRMREGYVKDTHFVDDLRKELRGLERRLSEQEQSLIELGNRTEEQESLRAELFAAKFKLTRSEAARCVLAGVSFEYCPSCGMRVLSRTKDEDVCPLCGQHPSESAESKLASREMIRLDLDSRIKELEESIRKCREAREEEARLLAKLREEKSVRDRRLDEELKSYDSRFLSYSREMERRIATFEEKTRGLNEILEMLKGVSALEKEAGVLSADEDRIQREVDREKENLVAAEKLIREIEDNYLQSLLTVGVPGVGVDDQVKINRTTWIPDILPAGEAGKWNFDTAGSAGKKTLLNVCFALSIHKVAAEHNLTLPTFLIIDTPMKNIGKDVNRDIFESFYCHLYDLARGSLSSTQFIIIDKEYFQPPRGIDIFERYMTPSDDKNPPLISYYRGP